MIGALPNMARYWPNCVVLIRLTFWGSAPDRGAITRWCQLADGTWICEAAARTSAHPSRRWQPASAWGVADVLDIQNSVAMDNRVMHYAAWLTRMEAWSAGKRERALQAANREGRRFNPW